MRVPGGARAGRHPGEGLQRARGRVLHRYVDRGGRPHARTCGSASGPASSPSRATAAVIAYGAELFEGGNMAQVYSSVAGNIFGMKDVAAPPPRGGALPRVLVGTFPGPAFGIAGIREALGRPGPPPRGDHREAQDRPRPRSAGRGGLTRPWLAGCDVVKDDENLTSQAFCPFEARLRACLDAAKRAEDATGCAKGYIPNVTAPTEVMLRRAAQVAHFGRPHRHGGPGHRGMVRPSRACGAPTSASSSTATGPCTRPSRVLPATASPWP